MSQLLSSDSCSKPCEGACSGGTDGAVAKECSKADALSSCRKCGGAMRDGLAIEQTFSGIGDFGEHDIITLSPGGPGRIVACRKCSVCGWSVSA